MVHCGAVCVSHLQLLLRHRRARLRIAHLPPRQCVRGLARVHEGAHAAVHVHVRHPLPHATQRVLGQQRALQLRLTRACVVQLDLQHVRPLFVRRLIHLLTRHTHRPTTHLRSCPAPRHYWIQQQKPVLGSRRMSCGLHAESRGGAVCEGRGSEGGGDRTIHVCSCSLSMVSLRSAAMSVSRRSRMARSRPCSMV